MTLEHAVRAGSLDDLQRDGRLLTKVGSPVLVVWNGGRAFAIEDRCPHLGFPSTRARSRPVS
jgi:nitrite reductase/ring-hydroxylating ferredoxin subunit